MISCGKIKLRVNPRKKVLFREYHPRHSRNLWLDIDDFYEKRWKPHIKFCNWYAVFLWKILPLIIMMFLTTFLTNFQTFSKENLKKISLFEEKYAFFLFSCDFITRKVSLTRMEAHYIFWKSHSRKNWFDII